MKKRYIYLYLCIRYLRVYLGFHKICERYIYRVILHVKTMKKNSCTKISAIMKDSNKRIKQIIIKRGNSKIELISEMFIDIIIEKLIESIEVNAI